MREPQLDLKEFVLPAKRKEAEPSPISAKNVPVIPPIASRQQSDKDKSPKRVRIDENQNQIENIPSSAEERSIAFVSDRDTMTHKSQFEGKDLLEFIQFLKDHPTTKQFVYLVPTKTPIKRGQPFINPYNLEIVDYNKIDKSRGFFTLSVDVCYIFYLFSLSLFF